ncbi:MAG: Rrf2 family transcriptional regulator [Bacteroidales bacterium]|jgi:Rrf2 family protein|nr:Rrf2 family transcriptional regulator [Bacteroidales bacterium]
MANIVNFSDAASIGLHCMIILAKSDNSLNAIQLSERIGNSKHHIGKVLQRLVKDGFLTSQRGPTGGFELAVSPEECTLYDIYSSIEGSARSKACDMSHKVCPNGKCIRDNVVSKLTEEFISFMQGQTLAQYL